MSRKLTRNEKKLLRRENAEENSFAWYACAEPFQIGDIQFNVSAMYERNN